jgi:hypothetical protein
VNDLGEFLLARIAEDHEVAMKATGGPWTWDGQELRSMAVYPRDGNRLVLKAVRPSPFELQLAQWNRDHIGRWDGTRVLGELAAKRSVVQQAMGWLGTDDSWGQDVTILAEQILRTMALPYMDHPDYRPEWRL